MDLLRPVDFTFGPLIEAEPYCVTCHVVGINDLWKHLRYSSGSIFVRGRLSRACPCIEQLLTVQTSPLENVCQGALRKFTVHAACG